jgi:hypothetical protein
VYASIEPESCRIEAETTVEALRQASVLVPGIELVRSAPREVLLRH